MMDGDGCGIVIALVVLSLILGVLLFSYVVSPVLDQSALTESQTLTVSTTLTDDNCDAAQSVGDGACNATVSILPDEYGWGLVIAVFMIVAAVFILAMLAMLGS